MSYNDKAKKVMLRKAADNFSSAKDDYKAGRYDKCISSLYYSAFQTVTALLIVRGEAFSKHTQVRAFVNRNLANTGLIDLSLTRIYNRLMDLRSDADYNIDEVDKQVVEEFLTNVEQFNHAVKLLIEKECND